MNTFLISLLLLFVPFISVSSSPPNIEVYKLEEEIYVYRSFGNYHGVQVSANGLIVELSNEVLLFDTPWDVQQTTQLLNWVEQNIKKPVSLTVITHAHEDRIGGIDVLKSHNIPTISNHLTSEEAAKNGYAQPDQTFYSDTLLTYGNISVEVYYPGPGHTTDNSIVYLDNHQVLYGGCFLKSASSASLGNIKEANLEEWPNSIRKVKERYPNLRQVIPGHGDWEPGAIVNTLELLSKERKISG